MADKKFSLNTYSASDVILTIGGYQITGWESITIARRVDGFVPVFGIRGKHTRIPTNDTSSFITLPILQTSQSNEVLSTIHGLDLIEGTGRLAILLKDNSGASVFSSNEAYIVGYPETVFSGTFEYRNWSILCQTTDTFIVGGNAKGTSSIFDSALSAVSSLL
jgi:hypothetical protein